MSVDRGAKGDTRQRRMWQRFGGDPSGVVGGEMLALATVFGAGLDGLDLGTGLDEINGELTIDLRDTEPGLELSATGLGVLLATNPGLEFSTGLRVRVKTTTDQVGITRDADGLSLTNIAAGTFAPGNITSIANLDATPTVTSARYLRVGNQVTVSGVAVVNPTALEFLTAFRMDVPVGGTFAAVTDAAGVCMCEPNDVDGTALAPSAGIVRAIASGSPGRVRAEFIAGVELGAQDLYFHYTYTVP